MPALVRLFVSAGTMIGSAQSQTAQGKGESFGASYADLGVEQRALVDDLFRRAGAITRTYTLDGRSPKPASRYARRSETQSARKIESEVPSNAPPLSLMET